MRAAIYARKSTRDERRDDESVSVENQKAEARKYIAEHDWTLEEHHIYVDDAVSGAEFLKRHQLNAMRASLHEFDVIVVRSLDRLGRDQIRTPSLVLDIIEAGKSIYAYTQGKEPIAHPEMDPEKITMLQLGGYASARRRHDDKTSTREGASRAIEAGHHAGGHCYGYRSRDILNDAGKYAHTILEIDEAQARVVRAIFEMAADGYGSNRTAKAVSIGTGEEAELNRRYFGGERHKSPTGRDHWAASGIRDMRLNQRYNGVIRWGKRKNRDLGGATRKRMKGDPTKMVEGSCPKIVDDALWARAQRQIKARHDSYARWNGGKLFGRPMSGQASNYLHSGLIKCHVCGANMVGSSSRHSSKYERHRKYTCGTYFRSGLTACSNSIRADVRAVDGVALAAIKQALTPEAVESAIRVALEKMRERRRQKPGEAKELRASIARLEADIEKLIAAIEEGESPRLAARVREKERQVEAKQALLSQIESADTVDFDQAKLRRELKTNLARFHELLDSPHTQQVRQALARLYGGKKLAFVPHENGRMWHLEGETTLGPLLGGPCARSPHSSLGTSTFL